MGILLTEAAAGGGFMIGYMIIIFAILFVLGYSKDKLLCFKSVRIVPLCVIMPQTVFSFRFSCFILHLFFGVFV